MKKIQKRVKIDYLLALDLYASGNYDAMYLASFLRCSRAAQNGLGSPFSQLRNRGRFF